MAKLTDTQAILLSTAAQRADGGLLPPPESLGTLTARIRKAITALIKRGLAQEVEVTDTAGAWRIEHDQQYGAAITDAGREAIGVEPLAAPAADGASRDSAAPSAGLSPEPPASVFPASGAGRRTKSALVLSLLSRDEGATLGELVEATGWLPHTTRAALTGLRKKGHGIARSKRADATCYRIGAAA